MDNSRTILVVVFLTAGTLLTTTAVTIVPAAYADNKQKAEDDSAAAIADCDDNEVEQAGFDCIAIATNDVEIEESEETATLSVCKDASRAFGLEPDDFTFTVTGNNPSPDEFVGDNSDGCVDVTIGPGEYAVSEADSFGSVVDITGNSDCVQDPNNSLRATGEIQAGETQVCTFSNNRD
jgi:hypothetical protein